MDWSEVAKVVNMILLVGGLALVAIWRLGKKP